MVELRDYQQKDEQALKILFRDYRRILYCLPTGAGKTILMGWIAQRLRENGHKILILVHREELVHQFVKTLKLFGLDDDLGVIARGYPRTPWAPIQVAMVFTYARIANNTFEPSFMFVDECFVAGTPVLMANGTELPIDALRPGDMVQSAFSPCEVSQLQVSWTHQLRRLKLSNGKRIYCTPSHPFFTSNGWVKAGYLEVGSILYSPEDVSHMQENHTATGGDLEQNGITVGNAEEVLGQAGRLLRVLLSEMEQPNGRSENKSKDVSNLEKDRAQAEGSGRERPRYDDTPRETTAKVGKGLGAGICSQDQDTKGTRLPDLLQDRYSSSKDEDSGRSGRSLSQQPKKKVDGRQERPLPAGIRVESIEDIELKSPKRVYNLAVRGHPSYSVGGVLVHNCHHIRATSWDVIMQRYPNAHVLGCTATPRRLDGQGMKTHFDVLHCGPSVPNLIESKGLCPVKILRVPIGFKRKGLKKTAGEYNRSQMEKRFTPVVVGNSVAVYQKYIPGKRAIMFGVTKKHARETAEKMCEVGIRAAYVGDDTDKYIRKETFERFGEGELDVVCNVSLIDEGFDVPECEAMIDAAPTASLARYLQRHGRYMRYMPNKIGIGLCLAGNSWFHGLPDEERTWTLEDDDLNGSVVSEDKSPDRMRMCQECKAMYRAPATECPYCGTVHDGRPLREVDVELFEAMPKPKPLKPGRVVKMTRRETASVLARVHEMVSFGMHKEAYDNLKEVAEKNNYSKVWAVMMAETCGVDMNKRKG